jgi:hypothetical protein
MKRRCVIQPDKRVHQLSTVITFIRGWVADTIGTCFILLLIYHWRWIRWERNPTLERAQWRTHSYHTGKEEFVDRTSQVHQFTEWIYTYPAWTRKETYKCQITQYLYMQNIITHTLIRATVVGTSGRAQMSWLLDVSLFTVLTSQNGKMRRNQSIETTSVRVVIAIICYVVNNKFQILWHVTNK